jgi:hypothetical protein
MRRKAAVIFAAVLVATLSAALIPGTATAFWGPPPPSLSLHAPARSVAGQNVNVVVNVGGRHGQWQGGSPVTLLLDGSAIATKWTDSSGNASFTISGSLLLAARTYNLKAVTRNRYGSGDSSSASLTVLAAPAVVVPHPQPVIVPQRTSVSLALPSDSPLGSDITVSATLKNASGKPMTGEHLALWLEDAQLKTEVTDATGTATFTISGRKLDQARTYAVRAVYSGSHGYLASLANSVLTIITAAIEIRTVPPLSGVAFVLGGTAALTGPDGVAALPVPASGTYKLLTDLNPDPSGRTPVKASFVRWGDNVLTADRTIVVNGPATYVIGLRIADLARIRYVDMDGRTLDPAIVEQAQFTAADGTQLAINSQTGTGEFWLTASQSTGAPGDSLTAAPVTYRAVSAKVHGLEALDTDQQSWTPSQGGTWTVRLALYELSVRTQDAVTGAAVSGKVSLALPNGDSMVAATTGDGTATFAALPAGRYRVTIDSAIPGMTVTLGPNPVPQVQKMYVITALDVIGLVGAWFGFVLLMVLTVLGRGRFRLPHLGDRHPAQS